MRLFDSHFHIIDKRFPLVANNGFIPEEFSVADYQRHCRDINIVAGAVVSGSFQAFDQQYLIDALHQLGPGFVGVTQIPANTSDEDILALHEAGIRAVRFNLRRGGSETLAHLKRLALRVHDLVDWHVELYVDARELPTLMPTLLQLPRISIDHLGLSNEGLNELLTLVERGARVKASGFGRLDFDVSQTLSRIVAVNPEALMFGTDLPGTRSPRAFSTTDIELILQLFSYELQDKVLYRNAANFYRLKTLS